MNLHPIPCLQSHHHHDQTKQGLPLNSVLVVPHCEKQKTQSRVLDIIGKLHLEIITDIHTIIMLLSQTTLHPVNISY